MGTLITSKMYLLVLLSNYVFFDRLCRQHKWLECVKGISQTTTMLRVTFGRQTCPSYTFTSSSDTNLIECCDSLGRTNPFQPSLQTSTTSRKWETEWRRKWLTLSHGSREDTWLSLPRLVRHCFTEFPIHVMVQVDGCHPWQLHWRRVYINYFL